MSLERERAIAEQASLRADARQHAKAASMHREEARGLSRAMAGNVGLAFVPPLLILIALEIHRVRIRRQAQAKSENR